MYLIKKNRYLWGILFLIEWTMIAADEFRLSSIVKKQTKVSSLYLSATHRDADKSSPVSHPIRCLTILKLISDDSICVRHVKNRLDK